MDFQRVSWQMLFTQCVTWMSKITKEEWTVYASTFTLSWLQRSRWIWQINCAWELGPGLCHLTLLKRMSLICQGSVCFYLAWNYLGQQWKLSLVPSPGRQMTGPYLPLSVCVLSALCVASLCSWSRDLCVWSPSWREIVISALTINVLSFIRYRFLLHECCLSNESIIQKKKKTNKPIYIYIFLHICLFIYFYWQFIWRCRVERQRDLNQIAKSCFRSNMLTCTDMWKHKGDLWFNDFGLLLHGAHMQ